MVGVTMKALLCLIGLLVVVQRGTSLAVMSIDLGSEWMKIAIVSPGKPMEIVLNTESQRKTPVGISFRDNERLFGDPAVNTAARFPEKSYFYVLDLIGKTYDSPSVKLYLERFPYYNITTDSERNTVVLNHPDGMSFTPEELMAMILQRAKHYAEAYDGTKTPIQDAVITVPPYFTQVERRGLLKSAQLAGLKVLQLLNSNTAVALNYGVFRRKDFNDSNPTVILFYDMGASSTTATVASYQVVKTKDRGFTESNPQVTIKGVGFDRTLGGLEMQLRLRDHLAKLFAKQSKKPLAEVTSNKRGMSKLFKESGRLKKVLSANTEHISQVENVMNDIDFKAMVNRTEFEILCVDLLAERLNKPIDVALQASGLNLVDIDQVIIFGGNTRIPMIQQVLMEHLNKGELGKSVNADEAAAMGAAYQAAALSKGFKVLPFHVKDANLYPIQVDFSREVEQEDGSVAVRAAQRTLFTRNNVFPQKKVLTFNKHTHDFKFNVNYGDLDSFLSKDDIKHIGSRNITEYSLEGVEEILNKHKNEDEETKGIKVHFKLDESGLLHLDQVEAVFELKVEELVDDSQGGNVVGDAIAKFGSTISKLFGRSSDGEASVNESEPVGDTNETAANVTMNATHQVDQTNATANVTKELKKEVKLKVIKEPIKVTSIQLDGRQESNDELVASRLRLRELDAKDEEKYAKEKAVNALESFISETKQKLYEHEYEVASTEDEREKLTGNLNAASEWLEYESDGAETSSFKEKLANLKSASRSLFERVKEHRDRPEAMRALNEMLNISRIFYSGATNMSLENSIFTETELTTLRKLIDETEKWKDNAVKEQAEMALSATPKLLIKNIAEKIAALDREVKYMINKARITPPPIPKKPADKPKTETPSNSDAKEKADETVSDQPAEDETAKSGDQTAGHSEEDSPRPSSTIDEPHTEL